MPEVLDRTVIRRILREQMPLLHECYGVQSLGLFGSCLHGDAGPESDLDLLVRFNVTPGLFRFVELENYLGDLLGIRVDLVMADAWKPDIGRRVLAEVESI